MNLTKLPLGLEPKRLAFLGGLILLLSYLLWTNVLSTPDAAPAPVKTAGPLRQATDMTPFTPPKQAAKEARPSSSSAKATRGDFRLKMERREASADPAQIDPGLRLDLLARLKTVVIARADRSLFDFAAEAPRPRLPEPKIVLKPVRRMIGPEPPPPPAPPPPPPPPVVKQPMPPLPFKFYGMLTSKSGGPKRAFLLEGEEIYTPVEGETFKKRYKVVRVSLNSVLIEDLEFKEQQSLILTEEPAG